MTSDAVFWLCELCANDAYDLGQKTGLIGQPYMGDGPAINRAVLSALAPKSYLAWRAYLGLILEWRNVAA